MPEYGLPLNFKAVCTETGREFGECDPEYDGHECSLCVNVNYKKLDSETKEPLPISDCLCGRRSIGNGLNARYAMLYFDAPNSDTIKLYQSTGLPDAAGKEIFFGDVMASRRHNALYTVDWDKRAGQIVAKCLLKGFVDESVNFAYWLTGLKYYAVGNIHTPAEQLRAAAEKVRDKNASRG